MVWAVLKSSFKFRQNQFNGVRDMGGVEFRHILLWPVALTACTTVLFVILLARASSSLPLLKINKLIYKTIHIS